MSYKRRALGQAPTAAPVPTPTIAPVTTSAPAHHLPRRLSDLPALVFMGALTSYGAALLVPAAAGFFSSKQHRVRNTVIGIGAGVALSAALPMIAPNRFAISMRG